MTTTDRRTTIISSTNIQIKRITFLGTIQEKTTNFIEYFEKYIFLNPTNRFCICEQVAAARLFASARRGICALRGKMSVNKKCAAEAAHRKCRASNAATHSFLLSH